MIDKALYGHFPGSASKIALAEQVKGDGSTEVIGVNITVLVLTENVKDLPEPWRKLAQGQLYRHAVESK